MIRSITQKKNYKYWVFAAISIGSFGSVVDHGSVNVAAPTIADHFDADLPTVQWVVISFALTISALLLPMGRLSDLMGRTMVYITGSAVFVVGAALAGFAPTLLVLILARILQGSGAAMTQGTGMAIIISVFSPGERGKAIGLLMTVVGAGAVAGPALGGLLVTSLDWRYVFLVNVPLGILGVTACLAVLGTAEVSSEDIVRRGTRFDWLGAALSTGALITFVLAVTNGQRFGWGSAPVLGGFAAFGASLISFIWWELRASAPLLDLTLFKIRTFSYGVLAAFFTFLGSSAVLFLTPFYLQRVLDYSPRDAGLIVMPGALCMAIVGPLSGKLSDRYGWRPLTVGGLALSATGVLLLSRLSEGSSLSLIIPALVIQNCGMGTFFSPNSSSVLSVVARERYGVVAALLNLTRNTANITSLAIAIAIVTFTMGSMGFEPSLDAVTESGEAGVKSAFTSGIRHAYLTMAGMLIMGMLVSALKGESPQEADIRT